MALGGLKVLAGIGVAVALAAFYGRPAFPDTASNHGLKTSVGLAFRFIDVVVSIK